MSTTYFANGSRFNPPKRAALPILYEITGKLIDARPKPRNNDDYWLIIQLMTDDDLVSVYFAQKVVLATDVDLLNSLYGRVVTLRSKSGNPEISTISVKSEESLRSRLLDGVIANQYKMEDLPALIAFSRGDDSMFEKWQLFKQQIDQEGVAKAKEELSQKKTKHTARRKQQKRR